LGRNLIRFWVRVEIPFDLLPSCGERKGDRGAGLQLQHDKRVKPFQAGEARTWGQCDDWRSTAHDKRWRRWCPAQGILGWHSWVGGGLIGCRWAELIGLRALEMEMGRTREKRK
jgi:hypothetical protein